MGYNNSPWEKAEVTAAPALLQELLMKLSRPIPPELTAEIRTAELITAGDTTQTTGTYSVPALGALIPELGPAFMTTLTQDNADLHKQLQSWFELHQQNAAMNNALTDAA